MDDEDCFDWIGRIELNGLDVMNIVGFVFCVCGLVFIMLGLNGVVDLLFNLDIEFVILILELVVSLIRL